MFKIKYILGIAFLSLLISCNQSIDYEDYQDDYRDRKVTVTASVENNSVSTRAGIIEGNDDYSAGETFYWNEGDKIRLYFVGESGISSSLFYAEKVNGNRADFTGLIPVELNGEYTIYATKDLEQTSPSSKVLKSVFPEIQTQQGASTKNILLPMISSPIEDILITGGVLSGGNNLDFSLKQLSSLLRFSFENTASQTMTLERIVLSLQNEEGALVNAFAREATIEMGDDTNRFITSPTYYEQAIFDIEGAAIGVGDNFNAYFSVLPSGGFNVSHTFIIEAIFKGTDGSRYSRKGEIAMTNEGDFSFLSTGFEAATRYYFHTVLNGSNLERVRSSHTITFEEEYWDNYVISNLHPGVTSTTHFERWGNNAPHPIWTDPVTTLTVEKRPDIYGSPGYPWFVSSYNSNSLDTSDIASHLKDLYVYNINNANSTTGGGNNGSNNFITTYGYQDSNPIFAYEDGRPILSFNDNKARTIKGFYVNSTNYFLGVASDGNDLSPAIQEGDEVLLTGYGYDENDDLVGTISMVFASFEEVITEWTYWDVSSLGDIVTFRINISGGPDNGYGFSLPAYYAIDDITVEWDE